MAKIKENVTLKLVTTKDGDVEEMSFLKGDEVTLVKTWNHFYLIKDKNGHYYNIRKEKLDA